MGRNGTMEQARLEIARTRGDGHASNLDHRPLVLAKFIEGMKDPTLRSMANYIVNLMHDARTKAITPAQGSLEMNGLRQIVGLMVMDQAKRRVIDADA